MPSPNINSYERFHTTLSKQMQAAPYQTPDEAARECGQCLPELAVAAFDAAAAKLVSAGQSRAAATRSVCIHEPQLHSAYIAAHNAEHRTPRASAQQITEPEKQWHAEVAKRQALGESLSVATRQVARLQPKLRQAFVHAFNARVRGVQH